MTAFNKERNIAIVVDTFYPAKTSAAIQMLDISRALNSLGAKVTVFVPKSDLKKDIDCNKITNIDVISIRSPQIKNVNFFKRAINEILMPFVMTRRLKHSSVKKINFDGVIWYSPSIFTSIFANHLSKSSKCRNYLILRDIFPKWSVDMGLISKWSPVYVLFRFFENLQYKFADSIGIQSVGDFDHFDSYKKKIKRKVHVLDNWRAKPVIEKTKINISNTILRNRKIFIYSGNVGVAQNFPLFLESVKTLQNNKEIGFLIIGSGSEAIFVKNYIKENELDNILFIDEIPHEQLPELYTQCHYGLILLDLSLKTHNIPGKFLSYLYAGLPVFASINKGNDLEKIIDKNELGKYSSDNNHNDVATKMLELAAISYDREENKLKSMTLLEKRFSPQSAAEKIIDTLFEDNVKSDN
ncbi:MAG: hypothetical protein CMQ83_03450 [Gammaproteobacteria bacterium]|nr:hypothetical protein [Gammaproteobacteria bacterium]